MFISKRDYEQLDAIIFDLGGVIIDVDMESPYKFLLDKSPRDDQELLLELKAIALNYEIGKIDNQQFINSFKNAIKIDYSDQEIKNIWNKMLGKVPSNLGELLYKINQEKQTFILSNTNPIHIEEVEKRFEQSIKNYSLEGLFDKIYYSHQIGLHKPDPQVFEYVIKENNLNPSKTLFIDDNFNNVCSAKNCGLQTIYMNPPMRLSELYNVLD